MLYGGIDEKTKNKIVGILKVLFPQTKIYLYGSRARGNFKPQSDIDLALDGGEKLNLGEARAVFEALSTPYKIDLVDMNHTTTNLRDTILREGKIWSH
jgi:uncharacterized protein